ncbi:RusA family crossover junction endodeoxyribonuclease [archaeon]|nr:MAG: RusA family crossover junction endodeoxyribonuclease [archaeon]
MPLQHVYGMCVDIDNLAKFVLDALNSVAYKDDCQVSILHIAKLYTDSEPGVQVHIKKLEEGTLHDTLSNLWE